MQTGPASRRDGCQRGHIGFAKVGQFTGNRGEFYHQDTYKRRAIYVRYVWLNISPKSARMERSWSADGGKTWEVNWICELSR